MVYRRGYAFAHWPSGRLFSGMLGHLHTPPKQQKNKKDTAEGRVVAVVAAGMQSLWDAESGRSAVMQTSKRLPAAG